MSVGMHQPLLRILRARAPKSTLLCFLAVTAIYSLYGLSFHEPPYWGGDAEHYWSLGNAFMKAGDLSAAFSYRGYLLPALLGGIQYLAAWLHLLPFKVFFFCNALITAFSVVIVLPWFVAGFVKTAPQIWQRLGLAAAFFLFWRGYLLYPLSDSWALFAILGAVAAGRAALGGARLSHAAALALLAGMLAAVSANMRPVFLIAVPVLALGLALAWRLPKERYGVILFTFVLGVILPLVPQAVLNKQHLGTYNPFVHSGGLYITQLFFGVELQRQECGYFTDPAGIALLKQVGIDRFKLRPDGNVLYPGRDPKESLALYEKLVVVHPLDFAALYARHVLNGSFVLGANIYKCYGTQPRYVTMLASMLLYWGGLCAGIWSLMRLRRMPEGSGFGFSALAMGLAPVMPVLAAVPTAIEGRFFMPLHLLSYLALFFLVPLAFSPGEIRNRRAALLVFALAVLALGVFQMSAMHTEVDLWVKATDKGVLLKPTTIFLNGD